MPEDGIVSLRGAAFLNFHLEPDEPLEVTELTHALASLSRQYQQFTEQEGITSRGSAARLLISNVRPGSIDINFIPGFDDIVSMAVPMVPLMWDKYDLLVKFAKRINALLDWFLGKKPQGELTSEVTIKDCDDVINIAKPIAQHGGHQTINIHKGDDITNIMNITADDAKKLLTSAANHKAQLQGPIADQKERVAMVWKQLSTDAPKKKGERSPDQAIIAEIDPKRHPIFFTDDMSYLKTEMLENVDKPFRKIFFVDVDVSRLPNGKVGNYRITGFHGNVDRDDDDTDD